MSAAKLNIGCGGQIVAGWLNLDRSFSALQVELAVARDADYLCAALEEPLPFPDDHFRCVVAHHVLDMLFETELHALAGELFRVLEPGGVLRVSAPDYSHAVKAMVRNDAGWFERLGVPPTFHSMPDAFMWYFRWGGARKFPLVCPDHLGVEFLEPAGFEWDVLAFHETTSALPSICELDSREGESWFLEARKP